MYLMQYILKAHCILSYSNINLQVLSHFGTDPALNFEPKEAHDLARTSWMFR